MTRIEITDTNGTRWIGDGSDEALTAEAEGQLNTLLHNFTTLHHLSLVIGGNKHYFNPAHIVSVAIKTEATR